MSAEVFKNGYVIETVIDSFGNLLSSLISTYKSGTL